MDCLPTWLVVIFPNSVQAKRQWVQEVVHASMRPAEIHAVTALLVELKTTSATGIAFLSDQICSSTLLGVMRKRTSLSGKQATSDALSGQPKSRMSQPPTMATIVLAFSGYISRCLIPRRTDLANAVHDKQHPLWSSGNNECARQCCKRRAAVSCTW